ncbi:MAG TPA: hypothetical protein VNI01_01405, partial [Elusimicrobiota bacterium]|nr:hypothetical protein [Elusimicrobiota bacterium]
MRVAGPLVLLCLLSAGAAADEDGDWTHMQSYTSGFGGTFGGDWVWHCKLCDKDYRLPTRHKDQADGWLASHRKGHGLAGGAAGANKSLTDQGLEAITKGIVHKDRDLVALGTLAVAEDIFLKMLFSPSSSGPTPEQAAVQRLRQSERINRIENARADNQFLREQLLGAAERQRRESEQRDAERSERLAGAFDVVPRRSTPFFGSPAGASDEEIAAALAVDPDPLGGLFDGQAGGLSSFESALRDDGVPLDGFPSQVDPNFFEQQRIRAASTAAFHQAHLPPDRLPPLAADGRNAPLLERAGGLVR